jgi:hypothetical protein
MPRRLGRYISAGYSGNRHSGVVAATTIATFHFNDFANVIQSIAFKTFYFISNWAIIGYAEPKFPVKIICFRYMP